MPRPPIRAGKRSEKRRGIGFVSDLAELWVHAESDHHATSDLGHLGEIIGRAG